MTGVQTCALPILHILTTTSSGTLWGIDTPLDSGLVLSVTNNMFSKDNMLSLAGLYADSANRVAVYYTNPKDLSFGKDFSEIDLTIKSAIVGIQFTQPIFNPLDVVSAKLIGTLPNGLVIDNGILCGIPAPIDGDFSVFTFDLQVTLYDATEHTLNFTGTILRTGLSEDEIAALAENNPTIPITLAMLTCGPLSYGSCGGYGTQPCYDVTAHSNPGTYQCRWYGGSKSGYCYCYYIG